MRHRLIVYFLRGASLVTLMIVSSIVFILPTRVLYDKDKGYVMPGYETELIIPQVALLISAKEDISRQSIGHQKETIHKRWKGLAADVINSIIFALIFFGVYRKIPGRILRKSILYGLLVFAWQGIMVGKVLMMTGWLSSAGWLPSIYLLVWLVATIASSLTLGYITIKIKEYGKE